jgi:excisionase family DNA binding protein
MKQRTLEELKLELLVPEKELARILGAGRGTLYKMRAEKGLPFIKLGIRTLYYEPDVMAWLLDQTQKRSVPGDK